MIGVELSLIIVAYVSFPLLVTAILAWYYNIRSAHRPASASESIYECADCGHIYAFARNRPMDRCPRCGHLNEAVRT